MADKLEKWREVQGYEGLYEVSNLGHVKGLRRGIILRGFPNQGNGYHQVMLYDGNGRNKLCYTHLLVAQAWLPEPLNGETLVMHINGDKMDNSVENLMWKCTSIKKNVELAIPDGRVKLLHRECAYIVKRYNRDGICMAIYNDFDLLKMQGFKETCIRAAARGCYKGKDGSIYKNYKWTVERSKK